VQNRRSSAIPGAGNASLSLAGALRQMLVQANGRKITAAIDGIERLNDVRPFGSSSLASIRSNMTLNEMGRQSF
jgi:hypothetical protein